MWNSLRISSRISIHLHRRFRVSIEVVASYRWIRNRPTGCWSLLRHVELSVHLWSSQTLDLHWNGGACTVQSSSLVFSVGWDAVMLLIPMPIISKEELEHEPANQLRVAGYVWLNTILVGTSTPNRKTRRPQLCRSWYCNLKRSLGKGELMRGCVFVQWRPPWSLVVVVVVVTAGGESSREVQGLLWLMTFTTVAWLIWLVNFLLTTTNSPTLLHQSPNQPIQRKSTLQHARLRLSERFKLLRRPDVREPILYPCQHQIKTTPTKFYHPKRHNERTMKKTKILRRIPKGWPCCTQSTRRWVCMFARVWWVVPDSSCRTITLFWL